MTKTNFMWIAVAVLAALPLLADASQAHNVDLDGSWHGTLMAGDTPLRLTFHVTSADDGSFTGTLDSLDQGVEGIPVESIEVKDNTVFFAMEVMGAEFEGVLDEEQTSIDGEWRQSGMALPLRVELNAE
ncbi:MAG: hypothetical protein AAGD38_08265 [Acidobacteriota bacterium]